MSREIRNRQATTALDKLHRAKLNYNKTMALIVVASGIAVLGISIYMAWREYRENKITRERLVHNLDDGLRRLSKPGFVISRVSHDKNKLGKLYVNGKPVSEVRDELVAYTSSNDELTPDERNRAIGALTKASSDVLKTLDDLRGRVTKFDDDLEIQTQIAASRNMSFAMIGYSV